MARKTFAIYTLLVGALVGIIGDLLFYRKLIGVSFPLFILIGIVVILASLGLTHQQLRLRNLWVLIPALFFAGMVAVRADPELTALNVTAALALCALGLHYLPLHQPIDLDTLGDHLRGSFEASFGSVVAPFYEVFDSVGWVFDRLEGNWRTVGSIGRGLVIATPVVLIFGVLLASADAVFAGYMDRLTTLFAFPNLSSEMPQIVFTALIGWIASGTVAYGVARRERFQYAERAEKPKRKRLALGMIEACILLGSIDLLFALFVIIQFTYFFGGRATLTVSGLTYADYARSGFFELVAVSVLTLGLVLALDHLTLRRVGRHTHIFRALAVILVALTGVLLVSASQRMALYEEQFGFSVLRVDTHVFMVWLAILFGFFLLALFRVRMRIFSLGVLIVMIGYLGTLDLMNVQGYVAERNIARVEEGYEFDMEYLYEFSVDAEPAILNLYQTTDAPELRRAAAGWLTSQARQMDYERMTTEASILSANLSRDRAWAALDAIRASLPS